MEMFLEFAGGGILILAIFSGITLLVWVLGKIDKQD